MHAHVFQHVAFEGPGSIGPWLDRTGHRITHTSFFHELIPAPCVQTEAQILAADDKTYASINRIMDLVLDYLMHSAAAPAT